MENTRASPITTSRNLLGNSFDFSQTDLSDLEKMLPELREDEANGEIAAIFADIRDTMGIPKVNLIYRYFATIDGALPEIWRFLRPYFVQRRIENAVGEFTQLLSPAALKHYKLPPQQLDHEEREAIVATLDFYLRANPMNLCALQLLALGIDYNFRVQHDVPSLLNADELKRSLRTSRFEHQVDELMYAVSQGAEHIRPTLLRDLRRWPNYLDKISPMIRSICIDQDFFSRTHNVYDAAMLKSHSMHDGEPVMLTSTASKEILAFCQYFPILLIRMTMIADILRRGTVFRR